MKKQVVIFHGMSCHLDDCFGLKLKEDLKNLGFEIIEPLMVLHPNITLEQWMLEVKKYIGRITENAIYVCHSLGTNFVLKFLEQNKLKAKAIIAVAGGFVGVPPRMNTYLNSFIPTINEFKWATKSVPHRFNVFSYTDDIWSEQDLKDYCDYLKAIPVKLNYGGHFGRSSKVKEIPELINLIKNIINI